MSMVAEAPTPRERVRATASKQRLFAAGMQLMGVHGPQSVTVDEIAASAGVSKGTVYYNFGSKDQMLEAMLDFGTETLLSALHEAASHEDPYQALRLMIEVAVDFIERYPAYAQLLLNERRTERWAMQLQVLHTQVVEVIERVLVRLVELPSELRSTVSAALFGAALFAVRQSASPQRPGDKDSAVRATMLIIDGLMAGGTTR